MIHRHVWRVRALGAASAALVISTAPGRVRAQSSEAIATGNGKGFDTHLFRPAMDSKGLFTVNGSDVLAASEYSVGLVLDYGHAILQAPSGGGALVSHSFEGTFQANLGLFNQLVVGVDLPIDVVAGGARSDPANARFW
ncbi:MAG: hypothetical protein FWD17_14650, partial [Polyangiaceae bacterium]|nr:hypothetical protein [Polyangiaceae bacterium]